MRMPSSTASAGACASAARSSSIAAATSSSSESSSNGSPSRGATYLGPVADVELVYPTRVRPMEGSAELALARAAPDPRPGSEACALLDELGAEYYVSVERDPAGLRYGNAPLRWDDRLAAWPTRGMELVSWADTGRGAVALWRITACG